MAQQQVLQESAAARANTNTASAHLSTLPHALSCMQVCIYKGFCVKDGSFAIIMRLYSYSLAARVARAPGACVDVCVGGVLGACRTARTPAASAALTIVPRLPCTNNARPPPAAAAGAQVRSGHHEGPGGAAQAGRDGSRPQARQCADR